uniref:Variant surface glycoprotein 1125.214 n=1 Tax=Trypanosoma brucei TaxID=5691 RepID=A0A1J0R5F7_9TRYP|nr:variant surface glycoprotein 1125.214 [Trypanosoma brucei]
MVVTKAVHAEEPETKANQAVKSFCTARVYFQEISAEITTWQKTAVQRMTELQKERNKAVLAAQALAHTARGPAYELIAAEASKRLSEAAAIVANLADAASNALTTIGRRHGEISAVHKTATEANKQMASTHQATTQATAGAVVGNSGNVLRCTVTTTFTPAHTADCSGEAGNMAAARTIRQHLANAKKLKLSKASELGIKTSTIEVDAVGAISNGANPKNSQDTKACEENSGGTTAQATSVTAGRGLASITTTKPTLPDELDMTELTTGNNAEVKPQDPTATNLLTTDVELAHAIKNVRTANKPPPKTLSDTTIADMASTKEAQLLEAWLKDPQATKLKLETDNDKVDQTIFGHKDGSIKENFLDTLGKETVTIPTESDPIKGNIQEIAERGDFGAAMSYFYAKNQKNAATALEREKTKGESKTDAADKTGDKKDGDKKDAECKATEEKDCDKTKCDWDKEKSECKVKEGAAVISYVMKAPLLLAFLI